MCDGRGLFRVTLSGWAFALEKQQTTTTIIIINNNNNNKNDDDDIKGIILNSINKIKVDRTTKTTTSQSTRIRKRQRQRNHNHEEQQKQHQHQRQQHNHRHQQQPQQRHKKVTSSITTSNPTGTIETCNDNTIIYHMHIIRNRKIIIITNSSNMNSKDKDNKITNRQHQINTGKRTEWSPIRSVIIRVITKSDDREAGV